MAPPNHAAMTSSASSLVRRLSTALMSDLSNGEDMLEITYALVLKNLLKNISSCGSRIYPLLKSIVIYTTLLAGIYESIHKVGTIRTFIAGLYTTITAPLTSQIIVPPTHSLNEDVLAWLAARGPAKNARTLQLSVDSTAQFGWDGNEEDPENTEDQSEAGEERLNFIPHFGKYHFRYKGNFMTMERENCGRYEEDLSGKMVVAFDPWRPQKLTIECFPTLSGTKPIKRFLQDVKGLSTPPRENKTTVYRPDVSCVRNGSDWGSDSWTAAITRPARSLESVALEGSKKDALVRDIAYYLTPECQRFYANRGYPYRRGFLFYGPPGTGKTSFSVALAGAFGLNVYILSMSDKNMTDTMMETLFASLPSRCILLLEDVDSAGLQRDPPAAEPKKRPQPRTDLQCYGSMSDFEDNDRSPLTLSGLLNCIDGPASKDGRIICMTSNAPDSLDPALIRPGRCDSKILFGYASEEICVKLFEHLYTKRSDELIEGETSASAHHDIAKLAADFASCIPPDSKISPAEVQGYLMVHRQDPQAAIAGAPAFADEIIEIKAKGKNVAEHANEVSKDGDSATHSETDEQQNVCNEDQNPDNQDSNSDEETGKKAIQPKSGMGLLDWICGG